MASVKQPKTAVFRPKSRYEYIVRRLSKCWHFDVRLVTGIPVAKTTRLHVAFRARNSGAKSGRELFKGSKDTACLLVSTQIKTFAWLSIFCEWHHKWKTFRPPQPTFPGPGLQPLDGSVLFWEVLGSRPGNMSQNNPKNTSFMTSLTKIRNTQPKNFFECRLEDWPICLSPWTAL